MTRKTAFVFPGQGSQQVGMLTDFVGFSVFKQCLDEASDALSYDIAQLVAQGPSEELNKTEITQPALLAFSTALYRTLQSEVEIEPAYFAGHSLGEYSALVAAGAMPFADALRLVEQRGRFMQEAVPAGEGMMAAILGLSDDEVISGCESASEKGVVAAVNFNTEGQVVIAGQKQAVQAAILVLKEKGAKRALPLNVSVPSHCELMKPAAEKLTDSVNNILFQLPSAPIIQNRVATAVQDVAEIRKNLIEQLYLPVRWTQSIQYAAANGVTEFIECGPGKVLTGLNKRTAKEQTHTVISDLASFEKRIEA